MFNVIAIIFNCKSLIFMLDWKNSIFVLLLQPVSNVSIFWESYCCKYFLENIAFFNSVQEEMEDNKNNYKISN